MNESLPSSSGITTPIVFENTTEVQITTQADLERLHEQIAGILRDENVNLTVREYLSSISALTFPGTASSPTPTPHFRYANQWVNWSVVLPIGLIVLFLLSVIICFCWQSRKEKRLMRQFLEQHSPLENPAFTRTADTCTSTRSIGSQIARDFYSVQHEQSIPPRGDQGSRCPIWTDRPIRQPEIVVDTITSVTVRSDELEATDVNDTSSGEVAWETPKVTHMEKVNILGGPIGYENPCFSAPGTLTDNAYCRECNPLFYPPIESPFIRAYDVDSDKSVLLARDEGSPSYTALARIHHVVKQPPHRLDGEEISAITAFLENNQHPRGFGRNWSSRRISRSISDSETLSLPSSISRFHASRQTNTPSCPLASTRNCSPARWNLTLSSSTDISDQYSDNTSLYPCVGSSSTSIGTQATSKNSLLPSFAMDVLIHDPIMPRSASAPETRNASLDALPINKSCSVEVDLFRSLRGLGAYSSTGSSQLSTSVSCYLSQCTPHHPTPVSADTDAWEHTSLEKLDKNQNVCEFGVLPTRKVKWSAPVLDKKQYWF